MPGKAIEHPSSESGRRPWRRVIRASALRFPSTRLLVALLLFIISAPFLTPYGIGQVITSVLVTVVFINAALAMGRRR